MGSGNSHIPDGTSWVRSEKSGLLLPVKSTFIDGRKQRIGYSEVYEQGKQMLALFDQHKVALPDESVLRRIVENCGKLAESYNQGRKDMPFEWLWDALALIRISDAILAVAQTSKVTQMLKKACDGDVSLMQRGQTVAKDVLWELEVYRRAVKGGLIAQLEEPDVVWIDATKITGVACKRIYSEKHIQNVLSEAVGQIEGSTKYGFAAFCLDELVAENHVLSVNDVDRASLTLQKMNSDFLHRHERHFKKYFASDRLTGAIVGTTCITILEEKDGTMPFLHSEWTVWNDPAISAPHKDRIGRFKEALTRASS